MEEERQSWKEGGGEEPIGTITEGPTWTQGS